MYHVAATGITTLFIYFLSSVFYRNGFYSKAFHRKLWNFILAAAFITAAMAGVFLALQITYKWEIPFIKTLLKWHVELGIALAITGIIHFIWHVPYFFKGTENDRMIKVNAERIQRSRKQYQVNLFITGFVSTSVQVLLMRELMIISGGYEMTAGVFLASWLAWTAAGSASARRSEFSDSFKLNVFLFFSLILSLILLLLLDRLYLEPGETPSFPVTVFYTFTVFLPFTFVSGFVFIRLISLSGEEHGTASGSSFSVETRGGVVAGLLISVLSYNLFDTYQQIILLLLLYLFYIVNEYFTFRKPVKVFMIVLFLSVLLLTGFNSPGRFFRQILMPGMDVVSSTDTPYGNITETEYRSEKNTFYNQRLIRWNNAAADAEERVHYAMLQHHDPEKVLVVSGDFLSYLAEIRKYNVQRVYLLERDPGLLKAIETDTSLHRPEVKIINTDAAGFMKQDGEKFDVVLLSFPPPSTLLLNRFYTVNFYKDTKRHLKNGGIVMCSPGPGENYFNKESVQLYSTVYNSISAVFRHVIPIVGNKLYYIASDDTLSLNICSLLEKRGIINTYVSPDFLSDDLISSRSKAFISSTDRLAKTNTLEFPLACFHFQKYNLSRSGSGAGILIIILILILIPAIPVFTSGRRNLSMFFTAGSLAGFEVISLVLLQSTAGNLYQLSGLVIASVMGGLALGSGFDIRFKKKHKLLIISLILLVFYLIAAFTIKIFIGLHFNTLLIACLIGSLLIPSFLTGQIFRTLSDSERADNVSGIYAADLSGSAICFALASAVAIPLTGIANSLLILSVLCAAGFISVLTSLRN